MAQTCRQIPQPVDQEYWPNPTRCAVALYWPEQGCACADALQQDHKGSLAFFIFVQFVQRRLDRGVNSYCVLFSLSSDNALVFRFARTSTKIEFHRFLLRQKAADGVLDMGNPPNGQDSLQSDCLR